MFCIQCGATLPATAAFCAQCGKSVSLGQDQPAAGLRGPRLWNPNAAANWSLLFTPVFGAYLHAANWKALQEAAAERRSLAWAHGGIALLITVAVLWVLEARIAGAVAYGGGWLYLIAWYLISARPQAKEVRARFGESYLRQSWLKPVALGIVGWALWIVVAFVTSKETRQELASATSSQDSRETLLVKNGRMKMCQTATVGQMVQGFMGNTVWESDESDEGIRFVNAIGDVVYNNKTVKATLQFELDGDAGSFKYRALELNEAPQADLMAAVFLKKMCDNTKGGEASSTEKQVTAPERLGIREVGGVGRLFCGSGGLSCSIEREDADAGYALSSREQVNTILSACDTDPCHYRLRADKDDVIVELLEVNRVQN